MRALGDEQGEDGEEEGDEDIGPVNIL